MKRTLTRREMLKASAAAGLGLPALRAMATAAGAARRKPNLLFLWTDEQRADTMTAYGNRKIHAPNLNKLAAQSVVFGRPYVSQPVCTPSRSTVMSGLWPHTSGCTANNIPLPADVPVLPEIVGDPDYRTAYMGKWHLGDEIFAQHGFEEWAAIEDGYSGYYSKDRDRDARSGYHRFLASLGYEPDAGGKFSRGFAARRPLEHSKPKFLETTACDFLARHRGDPFMLYVNFLEPHMPFFGPLDDEHDPATVDLPANLDDPLEENEPLRYHALRERWVKEYPTADDVRKLIARYWGLVTEVDLSVGAILGKLEELGLADNTIVVYTSDHGDMMGAHHMVAKGCMYEEAAKVPWLMRIPQIGMTGRTIDRPVSHIDMVPTLLDLMGVQSDRNLPGQSLVPLLANEGGKVAEDHVFLEWNPGDDGSGSKKKADAANPRARAAREHARTCVSPDGWKLCLSDLDKSQLFDLNRDPGETTNLFDSGLHGNVIRRLTERIHRWQASVGDEVVV
jgi:arylsulfatase A-like enzyme